MSADARTGVGRRLLAAAIVLEKEFGAAQVRCPAVLPCGACCVSQASAGLLVLEKEFGATQVRCPAVLPPPAAMGSLACMHACAAAEIHMRLSCPLHSYRRRTWRAASWATSCLWCRRARSPEEEALWHAQAAVKYTRNPERGLQLFTILRLARLFPTYRTNTPRVLHYLKP